MKSVHKCLIALICGMVLHSCAVYVAYGLYRTITDINETLSLVHNSMTQIQRVLNEGKDLKRAAEDGRIVGTLAKKIPSLVLNDVEKATKEKITTLSGDLKQSSLDFTNNAVAEDLAGAKKAHNNMTGTYNELTGLMSDLSETLPPAVK